MRKKACLFGMVLFVLLSFGSVALVEADSLMWSQTYGETGLDVAYSLVETTDGGYALTGYTSVNNGDCVLVKTDEFGYLEWNQTYGGASRDYAYALIATFDGGYAIAGRTHSFSDSIYDDVWLIKTDALGNIERERAYGGPYYDRAYALVEAADGGYALAGSTRPSSVGGSNVWLIKTDLCGNVEWNRTYGGVAYDVAHSLIVTSDGGYALAGLTRSFAVGEEDFWLIKTDAFGNMEWNRTFGGPGCDYGQSVVETSDGGFAIFGSTNSDDEFGVQPIGDLWLIKIDEFGNMQWNRTYAGTGHDKASTLVTASDGGFAMVGTWNYIFYENIDTGDSVFSGDFWLIKTDESGNMEWNQTYGGTAFDEAHALIVTSDGGYAMAGKTNSSCSWLVKTNEYGVVPEGFSWLVPSFLLVTTSVAVICKKKLVYLRS